MGEIMTIITENFICQVKELSESIKPLIRLGDDGKVIYSKTLDSRKMLDLGRKFASLKNVLELESSAWVEWLSKEVVLDPKICLWITQNYHDLMSGKVNTKPLDNPNTKPLRRTKPPVKRTSKKPKRIRRDRKELAIIKNNIIDILIEDKSPYFQIRDIMSKLPYDENEGYDKKSLYNLVTNFFDALWRLGAIIREDRLNNQYCWTKTANFSKVVPVVRKYIEDISNNIRIALPDYPSEVLKQEYQESSVDVDVDDDEQKLQQQYMRDAIIDPEALANLNWLNRIKLLKFDEMELGSFFMRYINMLQDLVNQGSPEIRDKMKTQMEVNDNLKKTNQNLQSQNAQLKENVSFLNSKIKDLEKTLDSNKELQKRLIEMKNEVKRIQKDVDKASGMKKKKKKTRLQDLDKMAIQLNLYENRKKGL